MKNTNTKPLPIFLFFPFVVIPARSLLLTFCSNFFPPFAHYRGEKETYSGAAVPYSFLNTPGLAFPPPPSPQLPKRNFVK